MKRTATEQSVRSSLLVNVTNRCLTKLISDGIPLNQSPGEVNTVGLLLGTAGRERVTVQDAVIAGCQGREEELFVPGACLDQALQKWRTAANDAVSATWLDVVGWFIYHEADNPDLSPLEIQFHNRQFPETGRVILILRRTSSEEILVAGIAALPDAALTRATQFRALTAIRRANPKRSLTLRLRETVTDESYARAYQVVGSLDREERWQAWKETALSLVQGRMFLIGAALCVFLICAAIVWLVFAASPAANVRDSPAQVTLQADLNLRVEPLGDSLMVTWNRQASPVLAAKTGVLHVEDGTEQRDISLNQAQIANGVVLYKPQSAPVNFQLLLHNGAGKSWTDTIRASVPAGVK